MRLPFRLGETLKILNLLFNLSVVLTKTHETAITRFHESQMYEHLLSLSTTTLKNQQEIKPETSNLIGTPDEVAEKIVKFERAGIKHCCGTYFCADSVSELLDQMEVFSKEVVPLVN